MRVLFHQIIEIIKLVYVSTLVEVTQQLLYAKTSVDVVADNSAYIETLFTIASASKQLCVKECVEKTSKKANLIKYHINSAKCFCFFATDDFRDSRDVAPISDDTIFVIDRKLLEKKRYLTVCDFTLTPEHASQISSNQILGLARDACLDLAESIATSEFPALYCPHEMMCGLDLVPANTSELLTFSKKSCNVFVANMSSCDTLSEQLVEADINECQLYPDKTCYPVNFACRNEINMGYSCRCSDGLKAEQNNVTKHTECVDVDECEEGTHNCPENITRCINSEGAFSCDCPFGYGKFPEALQSNDCVDVTECDSECQDRYKCLNIKGFFSCRKDLIRILGARIEEDSPDNTPDEVKKCYDGSKDSNSTKCYIGTSPLGTWLSIALYETEVTHIRLLFPNSISNGGDVGIISIDICTNDVSCISCGQISDIDPGEWSSLPCAVSATGNQIRIQNSATPLQLCEVQVYGQEIDTDFLPILGAKSVAPLYLNPVYLSVDRSFDGWLSSSVENCFHGALGENGWAAVAIPFSRVTQIDLLNRNDAHSWQMNGVKVMLCTNESPCIECGVAEDPGSGIWASVPCPPGSEGNKVMITQQSSSLQFCEIHVRGEMIEDEYEFVHILGADSAAPYPETLVVEKSYDGFEDSQQNTSCFVSNEGGGNDWATYYISFTPVDHVMMLNGDSSSNQTSGTRVDVCTNDESCFDCGSTTETGDSIWIKFQCPSGTQGNLVRVVNPRNYLIICEIKIYR